MASKIKTPSCDRCKKTLPIYEVSYSHQNGRLPTLFGGVVCTRCGKYECMTCKQGRPERPCSWCGYPVVPADEDEVGGKKKDRDGTESRIWLTIRRRWAQICIVAGLAAVLAVLMSPAYHLYWPKVRGNVKAFTAITTPDDIPDPEPIFLLRERTKLEAPMKTASLAPTQPQAPQKAATVPAAATPQQTPAIDTNPPAPLASATPAMVRDGDTLAGMEGRRVQVITVDGRIIEGFITLLGADTVTLRQSYNSGIFSMTLRRNEIDTVAEAPLSGFR